MDSGRFYGEEYSYQEPHDQFQPQGVCWCKGEVHHLRTIIGEEVEKALKKVLVPYLPSLISSTLPPNSSSLPHMAESSALRRLRLHFKSNIPNNTLLTMTKIEDHQHAFFEVELLDEYGNRVENDIDFPVKIKFDVLDGDYDVETIDSTQQKDYKENIVKPRKQKGELLKGECKMAMRNGVINVGHLCVTDNSSHTRSGMFRLGAIPEGVSSGVVIQGAVSEAFKVKERRLKCDEKLKVPSAESALWRLVGIGKNGPVYSRAKKAGVFTVGDFLQRLNTTNAEELRNILGVSEPTWNAIVRNARACKLPEVFIEGCSHYDDEKSNPQIPYQEPIYKPNDVQPEQEQEKQVQLQQPSPSLPICSQYPDILTSCHILNEGQGLMHGSSTEEHESQYDVGQMIQELEELLNNSPQQDSVQNPITKLLAACYVTKAATLFMISVQQDSTTPQKRQRLQ